MHLAGNIHIYPLAQAYCWNKLPDSNFFTYSHTEDQYIASSTEFAIHLQRRGAHACSQHARRRAIEYSYVIAISR